MSNEKMRDLLTRLHQEIEKTELDASTRSLMQQLDSDIHKLLDSTDELADSRSIIMTAQQLETDFAVKHPIAERVVREIVEALARIGV